MTAEQIVAEVARNKSKVLYLDRKDLKRLHSKIFDLVWLHSLHLRNNFLEELPDQICQLRNLESVYLQGNRLRSLPEGFGELRKLRVVELYANNLERLPHTFGNLENLEVLLLEANRLAEFPEQLSGMRKLSKLRLVSNCIEKIPDSLSDMPSLQNLSLEDNRLKCISPSIAACSGLVSLDLSRNEITQLPPEIGLLKNLDWLELNYNDLETLPSAIGGLTKLTTLSVRSNSLTKLPPEIGLLSELETLDLAGNHLSTLPAEIGKLEKLTRISLGEDLTTLRGPNPLVSPPPELVRQGEQAILSYLREQLKDTRKRWTAKLLLVGEGGVGKTSLLRSLVGEPFDVQQSTTHGIDIRPLTLRHPVAPVNMTLNVWDFGGQEIYHATHQFFLTNKSVFLLVWNARVGHSQSKLYYWLDTIRSLAPDSPILLVATHTDQRDADLPLEELRSKYPQIRGHWKVSNPTRKGIEEVRTALSEIAATLPIMGQDWPGAWLKAAEAIKQRKETFFSPSQMRSVMSREGVVGPNQDLLASWLHELGDILYYQDDEELRDLVILKPSWVTGAISNVLESERLIKELGIFTREDMNEIWGDIDPALRDHLLRLMERFDLSYRTLENREISIVVERLRYNPPDTFQEIWKSAGTGSGSKEIAMKFQFGSTLPAGLPTWFIARSHRFTTHTHWRYGAVFADKPDRKHLAFIQAQPHERFITLTVRGAQPQNFFALLREGLELTIRRFPGAQVKRTIPCPCSGGGRQRCSYEFDLEYLERAIAQATPVLEVQCQRSFKFVSVMGLLFGIHWRVQDAVLSEIDAMRGDISELIELVQREFLSLFRRDQSVIDSHCPNIFTLKPVGQLQSLTGSYGKSLRDELLGSTLELQLYCQAPGKWHPAEGGTYYLRNVAEWLSPLIPYIRKLLSVFKYSAKIKSGISLDLKLNEYLEFMTDLIEHTEIQEQDGINPTATVGADLRIVHALLDHLDPGHSWGHLTKILTPEGHYLWLCEQHAREYRG